jgi:hypothetical protein
MSGNPDNAPAPKQEPGHKSGDTRFDAERGVETFDGTSWVALEEIIETYEKPVFKDGGSGRS